MADSRSNDDAIVAEIQYLLDVSGKVRSCSSLIGRFYPSLKWRGGRRLLCPLLQRACLRWAGVGAGFREVGIGATGVD